MFSLYKVLSTWLLVTSLTQPSHSSPCDIEERQSFDFKLSRRQSRFKGKIKEFDNVETLKECQNLTYHSKGMAFNYSPDLETQNETYLSTKKPDFHDQLEEYVNCIVYECSASFFNEDEFEPDSRFDFYSLYDAAIMDVEYTCVPELGLFHLNLKAKNFKQALNQCESFLEFPGSLAYVTSAKRTEGLAQILKSHNQQRKKDENFIPISMAYVNLYYNRTENDKDFITTEGDRLRCSFYEAWGTAYPRTERKLKNSSCVALSERGFWVNLDCSTKLPFICEIHITDEEEP